MCRLTSIHKVNLFANVITAKNKEQKETMLQFEDFLHFNSISFGEALQVFNS